MKRWYCPWCCSRIEYCGEKVIPIKWGKFPITKLLYCAKCSADIEYTVLIE